MSPFNIFPTTLIETRNKRPVSQCLVSSRYACQQMLDQYPLQDVSPVIYETPPSDTPLQKALEAISYIGVIISIICLTVTVISYLANK